MAAIDKIYICGWDNYCQFRDWCDSQPPLFDKYGVKCYISDYLWHIKDKEEWGVEEDGSERAHPVMNNPYYIDAYIIRNCPLEFVQAELQVNYGFWSQKRIREYYEDVKNWSGDGESPFWAKLEDFVFNEDGTVTLKGLEKSSYEEILDGELYTTPKTTLEYTPGRHCTIVKSPSGNNKVNFERPLRGKWFVDVELPEDISHRYLWYHSYKGKKLGTWDFSDEFVHNADWSSSCATATTITALFHYIKKWGLPVGSRVIATGRYPEEVYELIVRK